MAKKGGYWALSAFGIDGKVIERAKAAGVPLNMLMQLVLQFGSQAITLIEQIIEAWQNPTPPKQAKAPVKKGCCDHHACCVKVWESAMQTADLAGAHLCECCHEQCDVQDTAEESEDDDPGIPAGD